MSIGKKDIVKNITSESKVTKGQALNLIDSLISLIISKSNSKDVKLSGFGTFRFKKTPKRIGRNPKTLDSYIIPSLFKLNFKPSKKVKEKLNWKKYYSHSYL